MKPTMVIAVIVASANLANAEQQILPTAAVIVCMDRDPMISQIVQPTVTEIFARVGIAIGWRRTKCPLDGIRVSFQTRTPVDFHPGTLGYAMPYERIHIRIFYDRIHLFGQHTEQIVLAYVIAHEITHILQGVATHSDQGLMKAAFTEDDQRRMARREPLLFTQQDVMLIHNGIASRARALLSASHKTEPASSTTR